MSEMNNHLIGRAEELMKSRGITYTPAAWDALVDELMDDQARMDEVHASRAQRRQCGAARTMWPHDPRLALVCDLQPGHGGVHRDGPSGRVWSVNE